MPLRGEISYATPERAFGHARAQGARSALLGLFEMLSAIQAVGIGLGQLKTPSETVDRAVAVGRTALRLQSPERCAEELEALALPQIGSGALSIEEAYVLDRLHFMIETLANVRDGLRSLRVGLRPRRKVSLPVHQDWFAVVLNGIRVVICIAITAILAIWSGLPDTSQALLYTAVFVSLGSVQPTPG